MTKEATKAFGKFVVDFLKATLKPGYLYGIGPDGELYCVEAEIPEPGKAVTIRAAMPKKQEATFNAENDGQCESD